ncbi:MAG TPA: extracellular solute-binding protein, partial [Candidatus Hydrogenedentes bacterium]|nr:extracellular solute-binding protein [Candidatus Hydrogenedentota bacterium]
MSASIQAGALPAMAVAYQSMTAEYAQAGAVADLEPFVHDAKSGLGPEELDDFYPVVFETNRYPDFGGKMLSFPFCKSVLMLYFNKEVLSKAGFDAPPATWDEFIHQCRRIKAKTGKPAYAVSVDCSTITGMIFSLGGDLCDGKRTLFDSPQAIQAFEIIETLAKEKLGYQITPGSYDDETALAQGSVAFCIRSSSGRTNVAMLMQGAQDQWGMARLPQGDPANPRTVLFGPNICIFNTTPEQQQAAWDFVKFFTSREIGVRWALGTGYGKLESPRFHVVAFDYGVKFNILRMLAERGCKVTVLPAQASAADALALNPDGIFLSNGPGDPEPCDYAIRATREFIERGIPTFGICLGHQIMALAVGAKTL